MSFRHSKIVCTIGPASGSRRMIEKLLQAGMDVARLNFSHGTHAQHAATIALLRAAALKQGKTIAILADLQGPKIRTGTLAGGQPVYLSAGQQFIITTARILGDSTRVNTTFTPLPREVHKGNRILLSDGLIELRVMQVRGREVICKVINGGALGENKGINLPGVQLRVPALTPKDQEDLIFALKHDANYIAVSFVRRPEDVLQAKALIRKAGKDTPVIAKLEKPEAIENLDAILRAADGVMVARGDLGVEMSPERVPVVQKMIIARAREFRRPVITATQMLESMTGNPRPTRAEASDVANAIFDGSDAVMLSAETASGKYPVEAVQMMARIIEEAEKSITEFPRPSHAGTIKGSGNGRGTGLPRFPRAAHALDRGVHPQRFHRATGFALSPAGSHHRVFSRCADPPPHGADLGSDARGNKKSAENRWPGGNFGRAPAGRKTGAQRRCHRHRGRNADGHSGLYKLHEVPRHRRRI